MLNYLMTVAVYYFIFKSSWVGVYGFSSRLWTANDFCKDLICELLIDGLRILLQLGVPNRERF